MIPALLALALHSQPVHACINGMEEHLLVAQDKPQSQPQNQPQSQPRTEPTVKTPTEPEIQTEPQIQPEPERTAELAEPATPVTPAQTDSGAGDRVMASVGGGVGAMALVLVGLATVRQRRREQRWADLD